ncbi:hypothetical protein [Asanoa ferruginea]|uniref:hypothetical protein n=1 Tax=Asanoa ferruginea TaxID=53367 RepID=UPI000E2713C9|nr:hypothetical protein [Asanoa ferruginea]
MCPTLLQTLVGLLALGGVALGAAMTLRQVRASRDGQLIDLFTRAIEQLASERISVRHGGMYALEQLSPRHRGHVRALITAFVNARPGHRCAPRRNWPWTGPASRALCPTTWAQH